MFLYENEDKKETNNYYNYEGNDFHFEENTPLTISVQKRNTEIIKFLLQQKSIDVNAVSEYTIYRNDYFNSNYHHRQTEKKTVFHMAIEQNNNFLQ